MRIRQKLGVGTIRRKNGTTEKGMIFLEGNYYEVEKGGYVTGEAVGNPNRRENHIPVPYNPNRGRHWANRASVSFIHRKQVASILF